jgi:hypothetical protein
VPSCVVVASTRVGNWGSCTGGVVAGQVQTVEFSYNCAVRGNKGHAEKLKNQIIV